MCSLFNFSSIFFRGSTDPIYPYVRTPMLIPSRTLQYTVSAAIPLRFRSDYRVSDAACFNCMRISSRGATLALQFVGGQQCSGRRFRLTGGVRHTHYNDFVPVSN